MKQPAEVTPYGHPRKSQTISWDPAAAAAELLSEKGPQATFSH